VYYSIARLSHRHRAVFGDTSAQSTEQNFSRQKRVLCDRCSSLRLHAPITGEKAAPPRSDRPAVRLQRPLVNQPTDWWGSSVLRVAKKFSLCIVRLSRSSCLCLTLCTGSPLAKNMQENSFQLPAACTAMRLRSNGYRNFFSKFSMTLYTVNRLAQRRRYVHCMRH